MPTNIKKTILIIAGGISLLIGGIGIFLPILPTTPLVLLAALCFSGSNEKLYQALLKSKYFGSYIDNYKNKTGVPIEVKRRAILFLWVGLGVSMFLTRDIKIIGILMIVGIGVTIHIGRLKTRSK